MLDFPNENYFKILKLPVQTLMQLFNSGAPEEKEFECHYKLIIKKAHSTAEISIENLMHENIAVFKRVLWFRISNRYHIVNTFLELPFC